MQRTVPPHRTGLIGSQPIAPEFVAEKATSRRELGPSPGWLVAPSALWLVVFLVLPLASIIVFSFWQSTGPEPERGFTLKFYLDYFQTEGFFDPSSNRFLNLSIFIRTLGTTFRFTLEVMAFCLILGYPIAYFLAMQVASFKWKMSLFLVCMVPFWTSYLIRAVAWIPMLGRRGLLNNFLLTLGIVDQPVSFLLYSEFGYTMALVQLYVVLSVGPSPFQIFREIIFPLSLPGVAIGMIFIFVLIMGEFATAVVVYGGKTATAGTVILNYYAIANYSFAAVNSLMLMAAMMIGVIVILKLVNLRKEL